MRLPLFSLLFLALSAASWAQPPMQAEPRDFFGVPFAREFHPGQAFSCQMDSEEGLRCTRASDPTELHGVPVKNLHYLFMDKRLYSVDMDVEGREAFDRLAAEMARRHGQGRRDASGMITHVGKELDIMLVFDAKYKRGEVSYVSKVLPCPSE